MPQGATPPPHARWRRTLADTDDLRRPTSFPGGGSAAVSREEAPPLEPPARVVAPAVHPPRLGSAVVPLAVGAALFMEFVDSTALSTALPTLAGAFHSDPVHLKLALTSYLLALAVGVPASGWVADRVGPRRVFIAAMGVFLLGSALCGLSHSLTQLVAARVVQGLGGSMMTPVGRLIVVGSTPKERLVSAMTWFTTPALIGPLVGPMLSGLILAKFSWPWIFYINIPVGVLGAWAVTRYVPKLRQPDPGRFDAGGFVLSAMVISGVVVVSEIGGVNLVPVWVPVVMAVVTAAAAVAYWVHARRTERPAVDLRLFRHPTFSTSLLGGTLVRLGLGATPLLLPLLLQVGLGWTPAQSGLFTVLTAIGALATKTFVTRLIRRFGFRGVLMFSAVGTGVTTAAPALLAYHVSPWAVAPLILLGGLLRSMHFSSANTLAYAETSRQEVSAASTLSTVVQQVGLSLGVSFGGLVLHLTRGPAVGAALTPQSFVVPFILVGATSLVAAPVYLWLKPDAGSEIRGRQTPKPL